MTRAGARRHARVRAPRAALLAVALLVGCAPTRPPRFLEERAAAERAYAAGRYEEAARHWQQAAGAAERPRDASEALYRAAASLARAGRTSEARAALEALLRERPRAVRAPRAMLDLARLEISFGDATRGERLLERVVVDYPDSGLSRPALLELARRTREREGPDALRTWLATLAPRVAGRDVAQDVHWLDARELEATGDLRRARDAYLEHARRFPYPRGDYWDDALYRAGELSLALGEPRAAASALEALLREQEQADLSGSYERPRFAAGRLLLAAVLRDHLGDQAAALRQLHELPRRHPRSTLVDDALWQAAGLERERGDVRAACRSLSDLVRLRPDSRYRACAPLLCPELPAAGRCAHYLTRPRSAEPGSD